MTITCNVLYVSFTCHRKCEYRISKLSICQQNIIKHMYGFFITVFDTKTTLVDEV